MSAVALPLNASKFDLDFWTKVLEQLSFPLKSAALDFRTLREQRALPSDVESAKILRLYSDDYIEIALVKFDSATKLRRNLCTKAARSWKANRLIKPLLIFTNGTESYAVIVPGKGIGGEAKVLGLSDRLYRTDIEVLESMKFPGNAEELSKRYDEVFFPYQKVRDEFFEGYRGLYERIEKAVKKELKNESTSYAQRFLGRLMFLYFLQRKGWLKSNRRFIDTINDYKQLNKLFYESLNQEGTQGIPFLNGSLFEREPYMTKTLESQLNARMNKLFTESRDFFNEYNFTVDETSPLEVEVSIDPALIGTVFENMLPEYERGSKGTFYTPRGESSFICRRALTSYLEHRDEISADSKIITDGLTKYIEELSKTRSEKEIREFREKLLSIRILDPAVGSGGFLLVMMQEIIGLVQEAEAIVGWKSDSEVYKKRILPNLYGFDIEPEAVEIARLRLWLSLIIDQKEPEPLPNLDMNIIVIKDSLQQPEQQKSIDSHVQELVVSFGEINAKYLNEHESHMKKRLKEQLQSISNDIAKRTGMNPDVIEAYMPQKADIIIMNPPYVRQESISQPAKEYYSKKYSLDKKSDLFAYFLVRNFTLLANDGVASVICSDKWLETEYGISVQKRLKEYLLAVYGQRRRTFGADINTVIVVYGVAKIAKPLHFVNLESYGGKEVRQDISIARKDLVPGKWFYVRPSKLFVEKLLPRLRYKLRYFAEIKYGVKTGANDFFYMKEINHLYESDYLSSPEDFKRLGIEANTKSALEKKGLVYVENEGGRRFVINKVDVAPIVRSPRQLGSYLIQTPTTLCFSALSPGALSKRYIAWGEAQKIEVLRGAKKKTVIGYNNLESVKNRHVWYSLPDTKPARILLQKSMMDKLYVPICQKPVLCDNRLYLLNCKNPERIWLYLSSTIFMMTMELYCRRLGGGAADIMVEDYNSMPVPDLGEITIHCDDSRLLKREVLRYREEINQSDRRELDLAVLKAMGFDRPEGIIDELYRAFTEAVEDRVVKASSVKDVEGSIIEEE
jgi:type II restriction/modification system DNA methylase subunit YeeA